MSKKKHDLEEKWKQPSIDIETLTPEKIYTYMRVEQILHWMSASRKKSSRDLKGSDVQKRR